MRVAPDGVEISGASTRGCFYGLMTLTQMLNARGAGPSGGPDNAMKLPHCLISDWPDFETRGLLHDVTRGKCPKLETLKLLVDRMAGWKINQLQLYIEHAFVFSFDPDICGSDEGLTPDEVRELDDYCRDRFIELVPAAATLGHMGRILSMPRYRHLAEVEATRPWTEMTWPQRLRGLTLDCMSPEAWRLVEAIWSDLLEAFRGPVVNLCGDEPWDLGMGKNRERLAGMRKIEAYVRHLRRTHEFCAARGRSTQIWSDVIRNHPESRDRLPKDATVLHWGYDDRTDYDAIGEFATAGLRTFACPGTSGWKRIINAMDLAERNIAAFAAAGKRHGASGLLNTDWGDHGHFNALACSWHGIAFGAAKAWDADHPAGQDFDRRLGWSLWGIDDAEIFQSLRRASAWAANCETWRMLWMLPTATSAEPPPPSLETVEWASRNAVDAIRALDRLHDHGRSLDVEELRLALRFTELTAEKMARVHARRAPTPSEAGSLRPAYRADWSDRIQQAAREYSALWLSQNKPKRLDDIRNILTAVGVD
jgi:hypothetical protein